MDFGALRNFGVLCWVGGNLASMHMRNLECAIVVFAKLRGAFVETSGCILLCGCGVCVGCSFCKFFAFSLFGIRAFGGLLSERRNSNKGII